MSEDAPTPSELASMVERMSALAFQMAMRIIEDYPQDRRDEAFEHVREVARAAAEEADVDAAGVSDVERLMEISVRAFVRIIESGGQPKGGRS